MDRYLEERLNRIEKQLDQFKALIESLGKDVRRPIKAVRDGYYEAALTNAGSILENILRDIWIREKISGNENRKTIEQLFSVVKNTIEIDRLVEDYIREIQLTRNRAAHGEVVTAEDTIESLRKLTAVLNWYFKRYGAIEKPVEVLDRKEDRKQEEIEGREKRKRLLLKRVWTLVKKFRFRKLFPRSVKIFLILLVLIYGVISLMSIINDGIYQNKIDEIKVEYKTYYNNLFPIKKTWLPDDWETRDCDAWDTYIKYFEGRENIKKFKNYHYFAPIKNKYQKTIENIDDEIYLYNLVYSFKYESHDELKEILNNYWERFDFKEIFNALKCNKISNPYVEPNVYKYPNLIIVSRHISMLKLKMRSDFLSDNYSSGIKLANKVIYLLMDFLVSSVQTIEYIFHANSFSSLCMEMIPVILSRRINVNNYEFKRFEKAIRLFLEKLSDKSMLYREYLSLLTIDPFYECKLYRKEKYHLTGKLKFWAHGFSIKRYFYKTSFSIYKKLFERIKYIRDKRNRSIMMHEFFKNYTLIFRRDSYFLGFQLNRVKNFGKVVLILLYKKLYGLESSEFLALQGTDIFLNEFTGRKFEILKDNNEMFLRISESFRLNLRNIDYNKDYKDLIKDIYQNFYIIHGLKDHQHIFNKFKLE